MGLPPDDDSGPTIPVGDHALKTPSRKVSLAMEDQLSREKTFPVQKECCMKCCVQRFNDCKQRAAFLAETHAKLDCFGEEEVNQYLVGLLKPMKSKESKGRMQYELFGYDLCRKAFLALLRINAKRVDRLLQSGEALEGNQVPVDRRKFNGRQTADKMNSADSFFNRYYHQIAETLAETPSVEADPYLGKLHINGTVLPGDPTDELPASLLGQFPELADVTLAQSGTVFGVGYGGCLGSNSDMQIRHINHRTMESWFAEYLSYCQSRDAGESERCSSTTFRNTYLDHWKPTLKMRETSQHARCATCAEFTQRIGKAKCEDERAALQHAQSQHIANVKSHRTLMARLATLSEDSCKSDTQQSLLMISLDGLDQSKTRWPRNLASSKVLERLWRPQIHLIGYICYGVCEGFFVVDADIAKDSSTELTVIEKIIDFASNILSARHLPMPESLVIEVDNTCREGKNQICAKWSATAVAGGKFRSISHVFGEVGHTHNIVDQRLSTASTVFGNQSCIQTPEDFLKILDAQIRPSRGRVLKNDMLYGSLDFKGFYDQYGLNISGLVPNARAKTGDETRVNHSWRFVRRCDLPAFDKHNSESWAPVELDGKDGATHDHDVIMLAKELTNSNQLSQKPQVILTHNMLKLLSQPIQPAARNKLADRACKEFLRTATVLEDDPWHLVNAATALRNWVEANQNGVAPTVTCSLWMNSDTVRPVGVKPNPTGWEQYAPGPVRQVQVEVTTKPMEAPAPGKGGRGRGRGRGRGPGKGKGRGSKKEKGDQEESKEQPKKKLKAPTNGTEGPDFFEGKVETDGRSVVVPPPQPEMPSPQQRDILLGSDLHGAGVKDDDDTPTPPVGQPSVAARVLGCPRCYYSKNGCSICRRPGYTPRGPNVRTTGPKAKADPKQKVKKPQAKTKAAAKSKFPKTPGRGKARGRARAQ